MKSIFMGLVLSFGLLAGCAHIKSGHYIQLSENDSLEELASKYGVNSRDIASANVGRELAPGQWYFIPANSGLVQLFQQGQGKAQFSNISYSPQFLSSGKFLWPVPDSTRISSGFGQRWGRQHQGVDIPGRIGLDVIAAEDGEVVYSGRMGGYGNLIAIRHAGGYNTVYAHLNSSKVRQGQRVRRGQVIAELGNTGHSTGPHLHFEVRRGATPIEPMAYIRDSRNYVMAYNQ